MKQFSTAALAVFLLFLSPLSAQPLVDLAIPHVVFNPVENTMCVPIVANRYQEIVAHQFALRYDPTQLTFTEVRFIDNGLGIASSNFANPMPGQLRHLYSPFPISVSTLPDTTVLFEVCFVPIGDNGYSVVSFGGSINSEFVDVNASGIDSVRLTNGSIAFGNPPVIGLRPGDTNADGTVNHTDLLNIGLAYGATGPARTTSVDDFSVIEARPWNQNLPDDINFANIDTDGNGTIEAADVVVLNDFYGQEAPGFWNPSGTTSSGRSADPALYLGGLDTINAGELVTLPIFIGNEDNSAAGGNGLAFTLEFNPDEVDASSLTINLENSFLGEDLLSIAKVTELETGRLEVALARKDRANAPTPPGPALVGSLSFRALNNATNDNYQLNLILTSDAYLTADQSIIALGGTGNDLEVNGTVPNQNLTQPIGAVTIYPNPTKEGLITLDDLPTDITEISLYTLQGRALARYPADQHTIDLSQLQSGVYIVRIIAGGEQINRMVRKVR